MTMRSADMWLAGGCLALIAAGTGLLILPALSTTSSLIEQRSQLRTELDQPADGPEVLSRLESDLQLLTEFGAGRTTPIPTDSDIAGLMGQLSRALDNAGLSQRDITTQDPKQLEGASALSLSIRVDGDFTSIYEALRGIESLPRLVRIGRLRIDSGNARRARDIDRSGGVRADFLIEAFFAPESVGSGKAVASARGDR